MYSGAVAFKFLSTPLKLPAIGADFDNKRYLIR